MKKSSPQHSRAGSDSPLWAAMTAEPGVGVTVLTVEGEILYTNEQATRIFFGADPAAPSEYIGKSLWDLHERAFVEERLKLYRRVVEAQRPLILRHIRLGRQVQSTVWPIPPDGDGSPDEPAQLMSISRIGEIEDPDGHDIDIVESDFADFGPLDVLTTRELEVLALLGGGMTIAETGATLHRSPKTIEKHRDAIAKKLNTRNRVELARIAAKAGLQVRDARRPRVS